MGILRETAFWRPQSFGDLWSEEARCYCLSLDEAIPAFQITVESIIYAQRIDPQPGDMIICKKAGQGRRVYIGRFTRLTGGMVVFESPDGLTSLICCEALLVITCIA